MEYKLYRTYLPQKVAHVHLLLHATQTWTDNTATETRHQKDDKLSIFVKITKEV